ncbi:hypothetical protein [Flammeovirga sp. OC4]|uniref:hypothetical protein n=1 Tax=Flammeovirga sp. OC4 TaxID=1382345 RepID=UPI0005C6419E|nr:hypothetical protein [Flammeovirga sp. OC4]
MKKYYFLLLYFTLFSCNQEPTFQFPEITIEPNFKIQEVDAFYRKVTFVNLTDTINTSEEVRLQWQWGDGKSLKNPKADTLSHTYPKGDSTFYITLQLFRKQNSELISETIDSIRFSDYPVAEPYVINLNEIKTSTWETTISWVNEGENTNVKKTYLTLALDENFAQVVDIKKGHLLTAQPKERVTIGNVDAFQFKNLQSQTQYFGQLEFEKEKGLSTIRTFDFTTSSVHPPQLEINTSDENGYLYLINGKRNKALNSLENNSNLILQVSQDLHLVYQEGDTSVYSKPFYQDISFQSYEETKNRSINESSDTVEVHYVSNHKNMYFTKSNNLFSSDDASIGAQVYRYQNNYRLFLGDNSTSPTFDRNGIHINLGPEMPEAKSYYYLNSNNTKLRTENLDHEIGLIGNSGIQAYRLYIYSIKNDTIYAGIDNIVQDNTMKFRLMFKDPSIDQNFEAHIDHLLFHTLPNKEE